MKKKVLSLLLTLCMILSVLPVVSMAAEPEGKVPAVDAQFQGGQLKELSASQERPTLNATYYDDLSDAGQYVKKGMIARQDTCTVSIVMDYNGNDDVLVEWGNQIADYALRFNFEAKGGDYLSLNTAYIEFEYDGFVDESGRAFLDYTYYFTYLTTAAQEDAVDREVSQIMTELDIDNLKPYEQIKAIYDYVCDNVKYEGVVTEDTQIVKLTAYSALVNGTATDYGIALAMYRLATEAGITCRVFFGGVGSQQRFWNSMEVDGWAYYVDASLDAGASDYKYFLKGTKSMSKYKADESFAPVGGVYEYGYCIREEDFGPDFGHQYEEEKVVQEATCTEDGIYQRICGCGYVDEQITPAVGHDCAEGTVTKEPTCMETGIMACICDTCGEEYTEIVDYADHTFVNDECTVCGGGAVYRISGKNRCATAYEVADAMKEVLGIEKFDAIIIASGDNFADALSGSYLAARKQAPILLYRSGFADDNAAYVAENLAKDGTVYILGGTAAVPNEMLDALNGYSCKRLSGKSRFDTNLAILKEAGVTDEEILICTGYNFADSLSASATGLPILMVNNNAGALTKAQTEFLDGLNGNAMTIIGGSTAVSSGLKKALAEYGDVIRTYGSTREETSVEVAEKYFAAPEYLVLAYSRNFPDGLCGGPLAYFMGAPLILTNKGAEAAAVEYAEDENIIKGYILGGSAAVSEGSARTIFGMADHMDIIVK